MTYIILQIVFVFVAAMAIDTAYILWFKFSSCGKSHKAAIMSVAVSGLAILGTLLVVDNRWMLIPDLVGLYFGTIVGMKISKKLDKPQKTEVAAPKSPVVPLPLKSKTVVDHPTLLV